MRVERAAHTSQYEDEEEIRTLPARIERHIPASIVLAVLVQSATAIWWAAKMDGRVEAIEKLTATHAADSERLVRIEERLSYLSSTLGSK